MGHTAELVALWALGRVQVGNDTIAWAPLAGGRGRMEMTKGAPQLSPLSAFSAFSSLLVRIRAIASMKTR